MVMDEFFDAWTGHKQSADFGGTAFNNSGQADLTDTLKRDRNHPSIVLYSIGNEIRDGLTSQLATATTLTNICHTTDPTRPVTQALFRPKDTGYYPGNFLDVLDVFGANYRIAEVAEACALTPHHAGVVTEIGTNTSDWSTITGNAQLTGMFLWTAFDYLGEAADMWPTGGASSGIMDRMGTHKLSADAFQRIWSSNAVPTTTAGTSASKIRLTADHATMVTDPNDVVYVKAAIADSSNRDSDQLFRRRDIQHQRPGDDHRRRQRQRHAGDVPRQRAQRLPGAGVRHHPGDRRRHHHGQRIRGRPDRRVRHRAGQRGRLRPLLRHV